jgi:hypothetical protein
MDLNRNVGWWLNRGAWALAALMIFGASAWAETDVPAARGYAPRTMLEGIVSTLVFGGIGIILAIIGFKLFDAAISFNVEREICENRNVAAAILAGAVVLGISIIIAVAVL